MKLEDLFIFHNSKSRGFEDYEKGDISFVTNGFRNNGVIGFVKPKKNDRIFDFEGICLSAFCEATVQKPPFLSRGNGGSGLLVLEPKSALTYNELTQIASYINTAHRWKFSYGRMVNEDRVKELNIDITKKVTLKRTIKDILPKEKNSRIHINEPNFDLMNITELFDLERGHFHALDKLSEGKYTTISRVAYDNGVVGFYEKPPKAKVYGRGVITVATTTGDAFLQLDNFIATDNVVILIPKKKLSLEELFFITVMINQEKWRVSYGRQCYKTVFAKTNIFLPVDKNGELDTEYINKIIYNSYNFKMLKGYIENN